MGNCNFRSESDTSSSFLLSFIFFLVISKTNFTFHYVIGKGGFGKVNFPLLN